MKMADQSSGNSVLTLVREATDKNLSRAEEALDGRLFPDATPQACYDISVDYHCRANNLAGLQTLISPDAIVPAERLQEVKWELVSFSGSRAPDAIAVAEKLNHLEDAD